MMQTYFAFLKLLGGLWHCCSIVTHSKSDRKDGGTQSLLYYLFSLHKKSIDYTT